MIEEPVATAAIWSRRCAFFGLLLAAIAVATVRIGAVDATAAMSILAAALAFAGLAILFAIAAMVVIWQTGRRGAGLAWGGLFLAAVLLAYPGWLGVKALRLPVLRDVSTDTADPPYYSRSASALAARDGHVPGEVPAEARDRQRRSYPDIQPIVLDLDADEAFQLVLSSADAVGWKVVDQSPPGGRAGLGHVDAVVRSLLMGLPSDITVRVRPLAGRTRIDVRAAVRFGRHDFGWDAEQIRKFAQELDDEVKSR
jgi:hypothetical protein